MRSLSIFISLGDPQRSILAFLFYFIHIENLPGCRVRRLNRRACLFSELVTGVTVAMVAQRYASATRKRKVRQSIVIKLLQD